MIKKKKFYNFKIVFFTGVVLLFFIRLPLSMASELTFKFTIPSLGGDPLMGGYYLQQAQIQNSFKEKKVSPFKPKSLIERFTESLTSQLLYRMADKILDDIFGDGNLNQGPYPKDYTIGNFKINLSEEERDGTPYYIFEITDLSSGQTTVLELPKWI